MDQANSSKSVESTLTDVHADVQSNVNNFEKLVVNGQVLNKKQNVIMHESKVSGIDEELLAEASIESVDYNLDEPPFIGQHFYGVLGTSNDVLYEFQVNCVAKDYIPNRDRDPDAVQTQREWNEFFAKRAAQGNDSGPGVRHYRGNRRLTNDGLSLLLSVWSNEKDIDTATGIFTMFLHSVVADEVIEGNQLIGISKAHCVLIITDKFDKNLTNGNYEKYQKAAKLVAEYSYNRGRARDRVAVIWIEKGSGKHKWSIARIIANQEYFLVDSKQDLIQNAAVDDIARKIFQITKAHWTIDRKSNNCILL